MNCQDAVRWVRIRVKALRLAYRVRQHTRQVRALKAKLEAYMAKYPERGIHDKYLVEQLRLILMKDEAIRTAENTLRIASRLGYE
jgi:hypothetical protein